jgi:hypothetical protein
MNRQVIMKYIFFLTLFLNYCSARSQDRKIIEQVAFPVPDSNMKRDEKYFVFDMKLAGEVDFYYITYPADGLKVKGM